MRVIAFVVAVLGLLRLAEGAPVITVDAGRDIAMVPRTLFGTNMRPEMEASERTTALLKDIGITVFRYPDAIDQGYHWDWGMGRMVLRGKGFPGWVKPEACALADFKNYLAFARTVGVQTVAVVNVHDGTPEEAAAYVAKARELGANIRYWCLGNEPYFKSDAETYIAPEDYVKLTQRFVQAMKAADPAIKVGITWGGQWVNRTSDPGRDEKVLAGTASVIDFIDHHFYTGRFETEKGVDPLRVVAGALRVEQDVEYFREIFRRVAPAQADRIEIQQWEWGGPPWPEIGGMQRLATAVYGADALGEFARQGITLACQYNFHEHACGLIPAGTEVPWNGKTVRPLAYAIKLWSRYMGPVMVDSSVAGVDSYTNKDWHTYVNYQGEVPYLATHATRSEDRKTLHLMVISRHPSQDYTATIDLRGFTPKPAVTVRLLTGPDFLAHNDYYKEGDWRSWRATEDNPPQTCTLTESQATLAFVPSTDGMTTTYKVPAHSVVQLVFERAE
jgi:hypothetical protein